MATWWRLAPKKPFRNGSLALTILVTGATGFLGSHLCGELVRAGYKVTAGCRAGSNTEGLRGLALAFRIADLATPDSVSRAVEGHDFVIHAAADI